MVPHARNWQATRSLGLPVWAMPVGMRQKSKMSLPRDTPVITLGLIIEI
jgi:hypothetical protein